MKVISKAAAEAMLHFIESEIITDSSKERVLSSIDVYKDILEKESWDDPDYFFDRKARIVKKVNGEYVDRKDLKKN